MSVPSAPSDQIPLDKMGSSGKMSAGARDSQEEQPHLHPLILYPSTLSLSGIGVKLSFEGTNPTLSLYSSEPFHGSLVVSGESL